MRQRFYRCTALILVVAGLAIAGGCHAPEKHYALHGRVVSKDVSTQQITVDNEDIPGFMPAMTMPYPVKDPQGLDTVQPGDKISADVVVKDGYWLQHLAITDQSGRGKLPAETASQELAPGATV